MKTKSYLVTFQARYYAGYAAREIRQSVVEVDVNNKWSEGRIVLAIQERLKDTDISCATVINYWLLDEM